ncbi:MAG: phage portal protein, partial [Mycobacterium sp.]|nr:phage portal protein [Mycobacterium sp.]
RGNERLTTPDWILDPQGLRPDDRTQADTMDIRLSAIEFWSSFLVSALELGEGIVYCPARDATGAPLPPIFQLNPMDLDIRNGEYVVMGQTLAPEELIIVRNRVWPGCLRGVGVWAEFAHTLNMGNMIDGYIENMLGRGIPAGYLQVTAPDLTEEEATRLKQRWMQAHGGSRRKIAVLNATTQFHPLQIDPKALELSELMKLSAWDICLIYGIPPYKLGINMGASNTYANIESQGIEYVQDALLRWTRRIESAIDARFPRGTSLKLNLDGLRRADTKTRYEAHKLGLDGGWLTIDEVREREDLPPMTDIQQRQAAQYAINRRNLEAS